MVVTNSAECGSQRENEVVGEEENQTKNRREGGTPGSTTRTPRQHPRSEGDTPPRSFTDRYDGISVCDERSKFALFISKSGKFIAQLCL
ncbi:unnamed protein product [Caenorhabditis auriculariae]|uniref:Uncharacterized protein n=1 Tax=Caenorhabditis auriculariae TaxID=2777116 RepID=A0A8S1HAS8_9PELO|nr:unnamed protein product [Caenorhabditis auriculariae]